MSYACCAKPLIIHFFSVKKVSEMRRMLYKNIMTSYCMNEKQRRHLIINHDKTEETE